MSVRKLQSDMILLKLKGFVFGVKESVARNGEGMVGTQALGPETLREQGAVVFLEKWRGSYCSQGGQDMGCWALRWLKESWEFEGTFGFKELASKQSKSCSPPWASPFVPQYPICMLGVQFPRSSVYREASALGCSCYTIIVVVIII